MPRPWTEAAEAALALLVRDERLTDEQQQWLRAEADALCLRGSDRVLPADVHVAWMIMGARSRRDLGGAGETAESEEQA